MQIGDFRIEERVGRGGMGFVHRAVWTGGLDEVPVAVKFLSSGDGATQDGAFLREARAAARLAHPNVVALLDAGRVSAPNEIVDAGTPYLVMEWVDGGTLDERPPRSWSELHDILDALLEGLAHAHGWGVLHRDLKPSNVLRDGDGVRLTDFGIGRVTEPGQPTRDSSEHRAVGSPHYMAPEQIRNEWREEGPWTDIYGLGALAWWLAAGTTVFSGEPVDVLVAHAEERPGRFKSRFEVPRGLQNWLRTALQKEPRNRYESAAEARASLRDVATEARTSRYPVITPGDDVARSAAPVLAVPREVPTDDHAIRTDLRAVGAGLFDMRRPPLVGRQIEKDVLWDAMRRVARLERAEAVVIRGDSGVGKSALAEWLARRVLEGGFGPVLRTSHSEDVGAASLGHTVLDWFGLRGLEWSDAVARLTEGLEDLGFATPDLTALDVMERVSPGHTARRGLADTAEWHRFLLQFAERVGGDSPTVWFVDDLQRSPAAREFVAQACRVQFSLLLICTVRERPGDERVEFDRTFQLDLEPLSDSAQRQLVHAVLPLEPALVDTVVRRAAGSPLFALQLMGDWVARDVLQPGALGYGAPDSETAALPESIQVLWQTRLDTALRDAAAPALEATRVAAVLGEEFTAAEWSAACRELGGANAPAAATELVANGLMMRDGDRFRFPHGLLRDSVIAACDDLAPYHTAAAEGIATLGASPRQLERIARHRWAAGDRVAGFRTLHRAVALYHKAADLDAVLMLASMVDEWAVASGQDQSIEYADALIQCDWAVRRRAGPDRSRERLDHAREIAFDGSSVEEFIREPSELRGRVGAFLEYDAAFFALSDERPKDALSHCESSQRIAEAAEIWPEVIRAARFRADILIEFGRRDEARVVLEEALASVGDLSGDPRAMTEARLQRGLVAELSGDADSAVEHHRAAVESAETFGVRSSIIYTLIRFGDALARAGRFTEAQQTATRARELVRTEAGWPALVEFNHLYYRVLAGKADGESAAALRFIDAFERGELSRYVPEAKLIASACCLWDGDSSCAEELLDEALAAIDERVSTAMLMLCVVVAEISKSDVGQRAFDFAAARSDDLPPTFARRLQKVERPGE